MQVNNANPVKEWCPHKETWSSSQHLGRINYLLNRDYQDPIKIDLSGVSGLLYIRDGQHRLIAAVCGGRQTIAAEYVGRPDIPFAQDLLQALV